MADDDIKQEDIKEEEIEETQVDEYKEKYLRALADYQNLEKQTQVWKESYSAYAKSDLIRKILEVLDDLEKAQEHLKDEGLGLVIKKLQATLNYEEVTEMELIGEEFDPNFAEVVNTEPGEPKNKILKVLQKGYLIKDKTLRPAKVVVSA